jgi:hypothetical protein
MPCNKAQAELGMIIHKLAEKHDLTADAYMLLASTACHNWLVSLAGSKEVPEAAEELQKAMSDLVREYELTEAEQVRVIGEACHNCIAHMAKYAIREERHGNTEKPGGLA